MGNNPNPRPGFDYWVSFPGQGVYTGTAETPLRLTIGDDGSVTTVEYVGPQHYNTDLLTNYADGWLRRPRGEPFCLCLFYKAVHDPREPAARHANLYANGVFPVPLSANADPTGKPAEVRAKMEAFQQQSPTQQQNTVNNIARKDQRTLAAVDDSVGLILDTLEELGQFEDTVVVWASDNGYFFREFGLGDKRWQYEPSVRIPWLMRYPRMIAAGRVCDLPVLNIDLAPTFLDLAGVAIPPAMQGLSLRPILEGTPASWRTSWLTEYFVDGTFVHPLMDATNLNGRKLIHYPGNPPEDELYDLVLDPLEIANSIASPTYAADVAALRVEREQLIARAAGESPVTGPEPANLAALVNPNTSLTWNTSVGAASYNVYFGASYPPPLQSSQSGTTYDAGPLALNTVYFWRVDAVNASGTTLGDVWSFTTAAFSADFDGDGDVDQSDFGELQRCYSGGNKTPPEGCDPADLDLDGDVDPFDFDRFQDCYGGPGAAPSC
jgi:arylsulfatase A-like enzyme